MPMSNQTAVREKYGCIARNVAAHRLQPHAAIQRLRCCDPITKDLYTDAREQAHSLKKRCSPRSAAAIPPR